MARQRSIQQEAVIQWVRLGSGSALVPAVAGAGKTTTMVDVVEEIANNTNGRRTSVAFCAYNAAIAAEIKAKLEARGIGFPQGVTSGTFHSYGFGAWRKVAPNVKVDDKKVAKLCETHEVPEQFHRFVGACVSLAKQRAFGVLSAIDDNKAWWNLVNHFDLEDMLVEDGISELPEDLAQNLTATGLAYSRQMLKESMAQDLTVIDYDDMIFAPLIHNARVWQNDWVIVDEAQDTNPARRALAKKMLRPGGRLIAVGDPHQAIYGFTGADNDSLDILRKEFACKEIPLTVSYRCPAAVVAHARQWVSHIESAPGAPVGSVTTMPELGFYAPDYLTQLRKDDAVLCRNTKPLVEMAFRLIRSGIACHVEGKDIGRGLMALATKWKVKKLDVLKDRLDGYRERETQKLLSKGQEAKAAALSDRVDTLLVIISSLDSGAGIDALRATIDRIFGDTKEGAAPDSLTLATIHKSKGREWNRVYLLGRNRYQPSPYARQEWQKEQELNLVYVAVTRAMAELVEVVVPIPQKSSGR